MARFVLALLPLQKLIYRPANQSSHRCHRLLGKRGQLLVLLSRQVDVGAALHVASIHHAAAMSIVPLRINLLEWHASCGAAAPPPLSRPSQQTAARSTEVCEGVGKRVPVCPRIFWSKIPTRRLDRSLRRPQSHLQTILATSERSTADSHPSEGSAREARRSIQLLLTRSQQVLLYARAVRVRRTR